MSLATQSGSRTPLILLAALDAANTAAATSAYVQVAGYEGQVEVHVNVGVIDDGSLTVTFLTASDGSGTGEAAVVPINGALTAITTSNDNDAYIAIFDVNQLKGYLKVVGTKASAGGVLVGYHLVGRKKTV
jgi:hypothetical protein